MGLGISLVLTNMGRGVSHLEIPETLGGGQVLLKSSLSIILSLTVELRCPGRQATLNNL